MLNINGKEWDALEPADIEAMLSEQDLDESFYFEFKDDKVDTKKVMEEVSAFANTFGGYIFLGVTNAKIIEGCSAWNEQRIHTAIHDSITPTPSFDVKKFTCTAGVVYVVRIDEGSEPPYITNKGKIYERLSSGSFPIKDSVRLSQIYTKREQLLAKMEQKISIPPVPQNTGNIYGYIDMGFVMVLNDPNSAYDIFRDVNLKKLAESMQDKLTGFNISCVGNSIIYIPGGLSTESGQLPAHTNNFLEIMADGSAKMRILLLNNNTDDPTVNMVYAYTWLGLFKDVYTSTMGNLFPDKMAYAKKYESLTVLKQFYPKFYYDKTVLEVRPDLLETNEKYLASARGYRKTGLYTIDKRQLGLWGIEYSNEGIIDELFFSRFSTLGTRAALDKE